jgi:hypothetical protein
MASMLARLESSMFVPVGTPKTLEYAAPVDKEEALHRHVVDACPDYPQLPRHLSMDAAVHDETCRGVH